MQTQVFYWELSATEMSDFLNEYPVFEPLFKPHPQKPGYYYILESDLMGDLNNDNDIDNNLFLEFHSYYYILSTQGSITWP